MADICREHGDAEEARLYGREPIAGVDDDDSIRLRSLHVEAEAGKPWSARAGFDGPAVELFASALCNFYRENGGENYVELYLRDPVSPHEEFVVTVQRKAGKTPHELRKAAEAELAALRAVPVEGGADAVDAARYRFLRDNPFQLRAIDGNAVWRGNVSAEDFDAHTDVAMANPAFTPTPSEDRPDAE